MAATKKKRRPDPLRALRRRLARAEEQLATWVEFNASFAQRFHRIEAWLMKIEARLERLES
jgi:hypothetical protein